MKKAVIIILIIIMLSILGLGGFYAWGMGSVSKDDTVITFIIEPGTTKTTIAKNLQKAGLIRSEYALDMYLFFAKTNIQAGEYELSKNMTPITMLKKFQDGDVKIHSVTLTLVEGKRLTDYASLFAENFDFTKEEFLETLGKSEFLQSLVDNEEYWFLTEDILNKDIYYPLEGYFFPDTYEFLENASIEEIALKILDHTKLKLDPLRDEFTNSGKKVHDILTMASIVEKEANTKEDREKASQVFYKRLEMNMSLGSDVTAYYGVGKVMGEELTDRELNHHNPYNTRLTDGTMNGKLPIGPISNPSITSIEAALRPTDTNYLFFVANVCTGEVFFQENSTDFYNKVYELQSICDKN